MLTLQGRVLESPLVSQEPAGLWIETFSSDTAGAIILLQWELLFVITVVWIARLDAYVGSLIFHWPLKCFSCVYGVICFTFVMWFGNSLDTGLFARRHNLVCVFSSEADNVVGLKPGEHFDYSHSIETLCFKVKAVDRCEGSEGKRVPTITRSDPFTPCYCTHSWCPVLWGSEIIENNIIIMPVFFPQTSNWQLLPTDGLGFNR